MMDLHLSSARSSNKNSQRWSIFLYLCCGRVGTEQVWTGRAPEGSTTLLPFLLSSMSFLSLKATTLFGKKRTCEQKSNLSPDLCMHCRQYTVVKRVYCHCYDGLRMRAVNWRDRNIENIISLVQSWVYLHNQSIYLLSFFLSITYYEDNEYYIHRSFIILIDILILIYQPKNRFTNLSCYDIECCYSQFHPLYILYIL